MPSVVRFGSYEADLSTGELRKRGIKLNLREQSFQVLASLLERPGKVVTREDLRRRLWHDDVFVDFDNNLNTAVARLREALCDSADRPRFVETLPKRGYRFIGKINGEEKATAKPIANLAAYSEYIKGRYEMWKWTGESVAKAKQHFEAALTCDPNFALACDGLAELYGYLGLWGFLSPDEAEPLRRFYGLRAFELDPALAEGRSHIAYHPQKCHYQDAYSYNWREAEQSMAAARDLNPNSPLIRWRHAAVLLVLGRMDEAVAELESARELDRSSTELRFWLVWVLFLARQSERGLAEAKRFVELEPEHHIAHMLLGQVYLGMQHFEESVSALRYAAELSDGFPLILGWLGLALGLGGHTEEARSVLEQLRAMAVQRFVLPTSFAWVHLGLGETDDAFAWMERAVDRNDEWVHVIYSYPFLDPLRADPRFLRLLRKLNLEH